MRKNSVAGKASVNDPMLVAMNRVAKLLALLATEGRTKTEAILRLADVGFSPKEIAELLGTTSNTVSVTLHKAKGASRGGKKRPSQ